MNTSRLKTILKFLVRLMILPISLLIYSIVTFALCFIKIRIFYMSTSRLGHLTHEISLNLIEREMNNELPNLILFFRDREICNKYLFGKFYNQYTESKLIFPLNYVTSQVYSFLKNRSYLSSLFYPNHPHSDAIKIISYSKKLFSFNNLECQDGKKFLDQVGISNTPFICFHSRDSSYLKKTLPSIDFSYHYYRDSNIDITVNALDEISSKGLFCLRMGAIVEKPLKNLNPKIIDYANLYRTDFLDVFLSSKCKFFIVSNTGMNGLPLIFKKPRAMPNVSHVSNYVYFTHMDIFIPKLIRNNNNGKLLKFIEMKNITEIELIEKVKNIELSVIENSEDEILNLIKEMNQRIDNNSLEINIDFIHREYWKIFNLNIEISNTSISDYFLKKYENLL